jgi:hypothetical protein
MNEAQFEAHRLLSIAKAGKIPKKSKQSGSGCDDKGQMGEGHCGDQMGEGPRLRWLGPTLAQHTPFEMGSRPSAGAAAGDMERSIGTACGDARAGGLEQ